MVEFLYCIKKKYNIEFKYFIVLNLVILEKLNYYLIGQCSQVFKFN